jgi:hypothetical protein
LRRLLGLGLKLSRCVVEQLTFPRSSDRRNSCYWRLDRRAELHPGRALPDKERPGVISRQAGSARAAIDRPRNSNVRRTRYAHVIEHSYLEADRRYGAAASSRIRQRHCAVKIGVYVPEKRRNLMELFAHGNYLVGLDMGSELSCGIVGARIAEEEPLFAPTLALSLAKLADDTGVILFLES